MRDRRTPEQIALRLQDAADRMIVAAAAERPLLPIMKKLCPHIVRQISADAKRLDLLSLWGCSCNVDENARQTIVAPAILQTIGGLAGIPMRGKFVHAGLEHSYGYLFSVIDTPYGRKRDRWTTTFLEDGFGLDPTLLGDQPRHGTLLGNLTWFLAGIAFRDQVRLLPGENSPTVAPEVRAYDFARLEVTRIVEQARIANSTLSICTDLVPFPRPQPAQAENILLVYTIRRGRAQPRLITAFPVSAKMMDNLIASARLPGRQPVSLRYNAYVRGFYGRTLQGTRRLA